MKLIQKIKRKLDRCDSCWKKAEYHFEYPALSEEDAKKPTFDYCCYDHAITSGFCMGCGYFCSGTEDFDFSKVKGLCGQCVEDLEYDLGIEEFPGECFGDMDYYDDYAHDFNEKQPQEKTSSIVRKKTEQNNIPEMFKSSEG